MCLVLGLDLACSGCNRSSLVQWSSDTVSRTMLISIESMDYFCIEQLGIFPVGLCPVTSNFAASMALCLRSRYVDGHRGIRDSGWTAFSRLSSVGTMRSGGTIAEKRCATAYDSDDGAR